MLTSNRVNAKAYIDATSSEKLCYLRNFKLCLGYRKPVAWGYNHRPGTDKRINRFVDRCLDNATFHLALGLIATDRGDATKQYVDKRAVHRNTLHEPVSRDSTIRTFEHVP